MKMRKLLAFAMMAMALGLASCSDNGGNDEPGGGTGYKFGTDGGNVSCDHLLFDAAGNADTEGRCIGNGAQNFVFKGRQTLKKGTYVLRGWIYVAEGSELTIEPGTVIRGDKETRGSLIVERGGKLIARGSATEPIVFTSNQPKGQRRPGDWGGVILCGKAPNNQQNDQQIEGGPRSHHGGSDAADNSGVLSYVRIEFAGYPFQTDKEINGLTLGSVGSGTQIDHVQVSYSNDDSFEWFGGTVSCKYLVAYRGWDDDFDTDNGYSGNVQFALSVRDPRLADKSMSNGFESDNCADGSSVEPYTRATFSNVTFIGPRVHSGFQNTTDYINGGNMNPNNGSSLGLFQSGMQIRRSSRLSCFNSLVVGFPIGLIIDGQRGDTPEAAQRGDLSLENIWMAELGITGSDANNHFADDRYDAAAGSVIDASKPSFSTTFFLSGVGNALKTLSSLMLRDGRNVGAPYLPMAGSPLLSAASFSNPRLTNFFDHVSYIGAFGQSDSWLDGWTNFDPENTDY